MSWLLGEAVECAVCHRTKTPRGRSAPLEMANGLCSWDCPGYSEPPPVGDLWPGETRQEFGYPKSCPVCETPIERQGPCATDK